MTIPSNGRTRGPLDASKAVHTGDIYQKLAGPGNLTLNLTNEVRGPTDLIACKWAGVPRAG
ncbi:hypothetical protein GLOTRDRAFT_107964 [Gloeophyllum trabeum ATCC 11539]|uniref:Uncharacterized protein n=1 Tax=Gloeophyllum trabeum (strain ATCC 11539 / FP-39264 / Madison 617) TaxID=670483 RepID=S7PWX9_GLOTA|nr:uncharacterized protein GLOTRDRAFT_107964 [Gloeophyllum trabeum ATCC 11539]EPQ51892.1 hypothetical protein GLOTRDRAFT_107964 [Gloeophyllum trabeum ATCC 11539]